VAVCALLRAPLPPAAAAGAAAFLLACQTHEGGFGGEPGAEAHGGYTWCAVAGLALLGALPRARLAPLVRWLAGRQAAAEGGFAGRANKLVDGCYSFWLGASLALVEAHGGLPGGGGGGGARSMCLWSRARAAAFVLACCQAPEGGCRDKPAKPRDHYHTCYALAGLALAQRDAAGGLALVGVGCGHGLEHRPVQQLRHQPERQPQHHQRGDGAGQVAEQVAAHPGHQALGLDRRRARLDRYECCRHLIAP
jgi:prenyltransferase beta subunit